MEQTKKEQENGGKEMKKATAAILGAVAAMKIPVSYTQMTLPTRELV